MKLKTLPALAPKRAPGRQTTTADGTKRKNLIPVRMADSEADMLDRVVEAMGATDRSACLRALVEAADRRNRGGKK